MQGGGGARGFSPSAIPLLEARGISKSFSGIGVLEDISLTFPASQVHVLFGENGAGKSTFINIIAGALRPDRGEILVDGCSQSLSSVAAARRIGIAAVFQEFSLAPDLTVEENLVLGNEPSHGPWIDHATMRRLAEEQLSALDFAIDTRRIIRSLSRAEQQMVEIAKALLTKPRVLILDEPTASLSEQETRRLFAVVADLKACGVAIIYISHRLAEIFQIGDVVNVLRDGKLVTTAKTKDIDAHSLVEAMLGRPLAALFPTIVHTPGPTHLRLNKVSSADGSLRDVSIEVRAGEIVGLAGLVGCGKSNIGRACFGLLPDVVGEIFVMGKTVTRPTPSGMLERGLTYLPSDRRREGLLLVRSLEENITLSVLQGRDVSRGGFLRLRALRRKAEALARQMGVRPPSLGRIASQYSGGNQQKIVLGKTLAKAARVVILDEPTVGVDVGAKAEIYSVIAGLAATGAAILLISSDLSEVINLCNRVYVVHRGTILAHLQSGEIGEEALLRNFFSEAELVSGATNRIRDTAGLDAG
jgi:ribose transport system ATP-binding protein